MEQQHAEGESPGPATRHPLYTRLKRYGLDTYIPCGFLNILLGNPHPLRVVSHIYPSGLDLSS